MKEQVESSASVDTTDINNTNNDIQSDNAQEEASYGKFNSREELLRAYNNLESEFTKRSQKLKGLEASQQGEDKEDNPPQEPIYKSSQWQEQVQEFVKTHPQAQELSEEIAQEIISDDALSKDKHCLELAYNRVLARHYKHPSELARSEEFIESYILDNDKVKDAIITQYLESLNKSQAPDVISRKGEISLTPPSRPRTLQEAGELATKLLQRRQKWYH